MDFFNSLSKFERRKTNTVQIGNLLMGSEHPIRIQSMTTTDTLNTEASVAQCKRIFDAGADVVRLTAQGIREAENLKNIRQRLIEDGYTKPLVADIHFNPNAAETAACNVEKVRINPGNFIDKRASFVDVNLNEEQYAEELNRLKEKFVNLLNLCKEHHTALRIGVNHGSLSDRIMSRYGDTPEGMVESAMEFLRICVKENFADVVLSMKASNVRVMVHAYRQLERRMKMEGMTFPLHLGVTEAGEGEDGRIKSAVGIGALLADGIGDTIRVSLTEEPEAEIPVAKALVDYFTNRENHQPIAAVDSAIYSPYEYIKATSTSVAGIGGNSSPIVIADLTSLPTVDDESIQALGYQYISAENRWNKVTDTAPDFLLVADSSLKVGGTKGLRFVDESLFIFADAAQIEVLAQKAMQNPNAAIILETNNSNGVAEQRAAILHLKGKKLLNPVIIRRSYNETEINLLQLKAAADCGLLFIDGLADGIMISNKESIEPTTAVSTAFAILQAARVRISKTEFISCPGCGRTLFDLQQTAAKIRERTKHLTGLKIGIMGCIVNGPGEMADADYGYVGAGPSRVTLYKGKNAIKKNIPQEEALEQLVLLIKENGDWKD
ncbi:(E)-4-hydroxy-3-methylbut-2-enyl-diphosphate synthase [Alistipes sp. ZOR0009]|uniref:(E)-4-hydroxy-3-methylbut-2-enyl-diphosphate synthase n=1 Tax=Alistipes sp. ZOR0009 TaxID=1339253 RepID=UPI000648E20A|nr:(E)-4-hydroxy-3-methylbut-2-enyl-diphosphate synthase [Alistipes sp. ZOR0009]